MQVCTHGCPAIGSIVHSNCLSANHRNDLKSPNQAAVSYCIKTKKITQGHIFKDILSNCCCPCCMLAQSGATVDMIECGRIDVACARKHTQTCLHTCICQLYTPVLARQRLCMRHFFLPLSPCLLVGHAGMQHQWQGRR